VHLEPFSAHEDKFVLQICGCSMRTST